MGTPMVIFAVLTVFWLLVHCWYSLGRHVTIGTPMVILAVLTFFWLFLAVLTVFDDWYTVCTVLVDLWRLVHQWFKRFWQLVQCTIRQKQSKTVKRQYGLCRPVTMGTPMVIFAVLTVFWLFLVHCWYSFGRHVAIGTPMVILAVLTVLQWPWP